MTGAVCAKHQGAIQHERKSSMTQVLPTLTDEELTLLAPAPMPSGTPPDAGCGALSTARGCLPLAAAEANVLAVHGRVVAALRDWLALVPEPPAAPPEPQREGFWK
jgi:hypothetical protein